MAHYWRRFSDTGDNAPRHELLHYIQLFHFCSKYPSSVASADVIFALRSAHQLGLYMNWWMAYKAWAWDWRKFCSRLSSVKLMFESLLWESQENSGYEEVFLLMTWEGTTPGCYLEIIYGSQDVWSYSIEWNDEPSALTPHSFHHAQLLGKQNGRSPENYSPALHTIREGAFLWDWLDPQAWDFLLLANCASLWGLVMHDHPVLMSLHAWMITCFPYRLESFVYFVPREIHETSLWVCQKMMVLVLHRLSCHTCM